MCANYYKVIIPIDGFTLLLCGTSAFNPQCDFRLVSTVLYVYLLNSQTLVIDYGNLFNKFPTLANNFFREILFFLGQ